jgi:hypothetical protein
MARYSSFVIAVIIGFGKDSYNPRQFEMHPRSRHFFYASKIIVNFVAFCKVGSWKKYKE